MDNSNLSDIIYFDIPGDKVVSVHMVFAALISGIKTKINNIHLCDDVNKILHAFHKLGIKIEYNKNALTISSNGLKNIQINDLNFSRASTCLITPLLITHGRITVETFGGCGFDTRPIDGHIKLLKNFASETNGEFISNEQNKEVIQIDCGTEKFGSSVGITAHAIFTAVISQKTILCTNTASEPCIQSILEYFSILGLSYKSTEKQLELKFTPNNSSYVEIELPSDQSYFITALGLANAQKKDLVIRNYKEDITVLPFAKQMFEIDIADSYIYCKTTKFLGKAGDKFITGVHPNLLTDLCPMISSIYINNNTPANFTETVYNIRNKHIVRLLDAGLIEATANGNSYAFQKLNENENEILHLYCDDIRSGAALLIFAVKKGNIVLENSKEIFRGYSGIEIFIPIDSRIYLSDSFEFKPFLSEHSNFDNKFVNELDLVKLLVIGGCDANNYQRYFEDISVLPPTDEILYNPYSILDYITRNKDLISNISVIWIILGLNEVWYDNSNKPLNKVDFKIETHVKVPSEIETDIAIKEIIKMLRNTMKISRLSFLLPQFL